jgi:hypothetical protein
MTNEKRCLEEWNNGTLEYWVKKKVFSFLNNIPSFQYSIIPE